ncbi:MAG TPA: FtsX-like permease family protein, partial [Chryseolinea sp.]
MNNKGWGKVIDGIGSWAQTFIFSFIQLKPGVSADALKAKMPALMEKHGAKELKAMGFINTPGLQPLKDMHLYSAQEFSRSTPLTDIGPSGNISSVYIVGSIGVFILLIACINFINLTTAKAFQRAGEVGVRKSLGASRTVLVRQFLGESLLITFIAVLLSVVFVELTLPIFNSITQKSLSINAENIGFILAMLGGIAFATGVLSGSYPAFFLSGFQPARVLKEKYSSPSSTSLLRKSLVVFQFVISITLISAILIIEKQIRFVQSKPLGFNPEYKITIPIQTGEAKLGIENLKARFKELSGVSEVSASSALPATPTVRNLPLYRDGAAAESAVAHFWISIDEDYFDMLGVKLLQGRNLNMETDASGFLVPLTRIVVNEQSLRENNIDLAEAVGTKLHVELNGQHLEFEIVGVVQDFHQFSMHKSVAPMMFILPLSQMMDYSALCIAMRASNFDQTVAALKNIWKELMPNSVFEYSILTDSIKKQYEADQRVFAVIAIFTTIAIVLSCLGLYGLSIFTAERKLKEIGIRKVFGANVNQIVSILSFDFLKLIFIAILIAVPVGYYVMTKWLENFAYKIEVDATIFILAGFAAITIAGVTIGFEAVKAALRNPIDSIRNE